MLNVVHSSIMGVGKGLVTFFREFFHSMSSLHAASAFALGVLIGGMELAALGAASFAVFHAASIVIIPHVLSVMDSLFIKAQVA